MRRTLLALLAAALCAGVLPAAAADDAPGYRALTINTPGQSGHVSVPEFALRTAGQDQPYGAHTTHQLGLYTDLRYTDAARRQRDPRVDGRTDLA